MTKADDGSKKIEEEAAKEALGVKAVIKKPKNQKEVLSSGQELNRTSPSNPHSLLGQIEHLSFRKQLLSTTGETKSGSSDQNSTS